MVGYYNTLPFLHGLEQQDTFDIRLDIPSKCITYFDSGDVNIALVPVGNLLERSDYEIITDFCIGCVGEVRTVCLFSNSDIKSIQKIFLDKDSRTSQRLVKVLSNRKWGIRPEFEEVDVNSFDLNQLTESEAILAIGDKVFNVENEFIHKIDLGVAWEELTGLPFVFAVWIARKNVNASIVEALNERLKLGVYNLEEVVAQYKGVDSKIDLFEYFKEYIDYSFDVKKKEALELFFEYNALSVPV